ncbi:MAG: tetracycline resistance MFS efflux pump, partial [Archangium sp.]
VGLSSLVVQGGLVRPIVQRLGERSTLLLGLSCGAAGFALYGLAPTAVLFWLGVPVLALWGLFGPASQGLMSSRISQSEQGQLQGALSSLMGIAGMLGPALFTETFAYFIGARSDWGLPGAPFLLAALLLVLAVGLAGRATSPRREVAVAPTTA